MTTTRRTAEDTKSSVVVPGLLAVVPVRVALCPRSSRSRQQPRQPVFRSGTRLIVADGQREGQGRQADRGADREGLRRHRGRRAADDQLRRVPAAAPTGRPRRARPTPAPPVPAAPPAAPSRDRRRQIAIPPPGDIRYRDRRLMVLYFDLTAMPPADLMRAYAAARRVHRHADDSRRICWRS